jgi:hypothetical protein
MPCSSCATILGVAVSPVTGTVDLCCIALDHQRWYLAPLAPLGGVILGPFWALANGYYYDWNYKREWGRDFVRVLQPFTSVAVFESGDHWPPGGPPPEK